MRISDLTRQRIYVLAAAENKLTNEKLFRTNEVYNIRAGTIDIDKCNCLITRHMVIEKGESELFVQATTDILSTVHLIFN